MGDGLLAEEEDLVDIAVISGTRTDARVYLAELGHDREHFLLYHLRCCALTGEVGLVRAEDDRHIDTEGAEVWHPEEGDPFIAIVVGIDEEDDIALSNLFAKSSAVLRTGGGVDYGGGYVFGGTDTRRKSNLREDGLYLGVEELVFDEGGDEA